MLTEYHDETSMNVSSTRILCSGCWSHIYIFHEFQQSVLKARTLLQETKDEQKIEMYLMQEMSVMSADNNCALSEDNMSEGNPVDFSSDLNEDVPLKTLFRQNRIKTRARTKRSSEKSKADDNNVKTVKDSPTKPTCPTPASEEEHLNKESETNSISSVTGEKPFNIKFENESSPDNEQDVATLKAGKMSLYENDITCNKNMKPRRKGRAQNSSLNENNAITSSKNKRNKLLRPVRRNRTAVDQNKDTKPSSVKLKEKRKEDDTFIAQWKPILDCDLCPITVSNFDEMRDHFSTTHNTRYYIKCCERKFYRRYALIAHIRLHVNPESYKCDICGRLSTTKHNLQLHKKVVHSELKEFECEICHKLFNQKPNLERHLLIHVEGDKKFFCKECGRGYVLEVQLKSHMKSVHEGNHICDQCGKICHGQGALKTHLMEHSGVTKRKFPCDICGVEIVTKIGLKRHKAAFHHDGSTAYVCGICGKVTSSENALRHHKKYVHEKNKKYKCTYCDKAFMQPKGLREHIASHTGIDLYQCPHCPQTFKVSANMHHHRKRAHPIEWEEARKNKVALPKVNIEQCTNQVVL